MTFYPVIERELRLRSRQGTMYWGRCGAAAMASLFAVYFAGSFTGAIGTSSIGTATFGFLSWLGLLIACSFFVMTADSISLERRDGTLGLLFLTRLRTFDVIAGKLVAAGLTGFFALIAALPALGLALLSGGVTGGQVARTTLSLLVILVVSLAVGMVASVRAESQAEAWRRGGVLLLAILVGPWIAAIFLRPLAALSPLRSFFAASDLSFQASPLGYWCALLLSVLEAALFLVIAVLLLRRNWGQMERKHALQPRPWFISKIRAPKAPPLSDRHSGLLEKDPVCWLSLRVHDQSRLIWAGALLMLLSRPASSLLFMPVRAFGLGAGIASGIMLFSSVVPGIIFAWAAGKFFFEARQTGELELLLSTPLGGRDIVRGRWNALLVRVRGPLLLVGFIMFLEFIFMGGAGNILVAGGSRFIFQQVMAPINMVLTTVAVFWVGMWFGLRARRPVAVIAWPVGLVIGLPWLLQYLLIILVSMGGPMALGMFSWWTGWPLLILAKNVFFIRWAAGKLKTEFRTVAPLAVGNWFKEPEEMGRPVC